MPQEQQSVLKRKEVEEEDAETFAELGRVVYAEGRLQQVYAGIGLPRTEKKVRLVLEEYQVVRERGLAVSQRLAQYAGKTALQEEDGSYCSFCRVHLSTSEKR